MAPVPHAAAQLDPAPSPGSVSYEDFLRQDREGSAEWVNGEVIAMSPAGSRHQLVADFLTALLRLFVEARDLGVVLSAPFQMKTAPDLPGREPDLLFVARAHLDRLKDTHLAGPADLAVEIVSPESRTRDRGQKFHEYERGGVCEYWLVDPERKQVDIYRLGEDGFYQPLPGGPDGLLRSREIEGLWLKAEWLWQEPLPPILSVLKLWGLVE